MPPNSPQNPNTPWNNPNTQQSQSDILRENAIAFAKKKYQKEWPKFYNLVREWSQTKDTIISLFQDYHEFSTPVWNIINQTAGTRATLSNAEKDEVYEVIQTETFKLWLVLQNKRESFFHVVDARYELTKTEKKKVTEYISWLKENELTELVEHTVGDGLKMIDFFKQLGFKKTPIHTWFSKFILQLNLSETTLTSSQKKTLYGLYNVHDRAKYLSDNEIEDLFLWPNAIFKTKAQKKQFLKYFFPVVSLQQLHDLWGISEKAIMNAIEEQVGGDARAFWIQDIQAIRSKIDISKIKIPTSRLDLSDDEIYTILQGPALEEFTSELNRVKEQIAQKDNKRAPNGLRNFLSWLQEKEKNGNTFITGIDKFKSGNVLEMKFKSWDENVSEYYEIIETDIETSDGKKWILIALIAEGNTFFQDGKKRVFKKSYAALESFFSWNNEGEQTRPTWVDVLDMAAFRSHKLPSMTKVERDPLVDKRDAIVQEAQIKWEEAKVLEDKLDEYKKEKLSLKWEIDTLQQSLDGGNLSDLDREKTLEKKSELEWKVKKLTLLEEETRIALEEKRQEVEALEKNIGEYEKITYENLITRLNNTDKEGMTTPLEVGTYILPTTSNTLWWKISGVDKRNGNIELEQLWWMKEVVSFDAFLSGFQKHKAKRVRMTNFNDLRARMAGYNWKFDKLKNSFSDIKEDKGELYLDIWGKNSEKPLQYFINKDNELLKIESIDGNQITFHTGKVKEKTTKWGWGKFHKPQAYYEISKDTTTISLEYFYQVISNYGYIPEKNNLVDKSHENFTDPGMKTSLWKRFRQWYSVSSMMHGIHMIGESIQHSWEHWDEVIAAHFALKMWKFLPEEWRRDLQQTVESHEKEETEKYVKQLKAVDSSIATKRVYDWIKNRDTPTYQLEAAVTFMYQWYGNLYMKAGLESHRGEWLWYRAFWGTPGDEFYRKSEKECYDRNITFTEEKLLYWWIKHICKQQESGHHLHWVRHLRSRLHKELKWMWPEGISKEWNDGKKDAADIRTTPAILEFMFSELDGWGHGNVFWDGSGNGAFERLIARWWKLWEYEMIPFVCMFSGEIYGMDEKIIRHIKNSSAKGMVTVAPFFMSKYHDMPKYINTIMDLCKDIQDAYPQEHAWIFEDAVSMFTSVFNFQWDPRAYGTDRRPWWASYNQNRKDRLRNAWNFFEKHWEILTDAMYTANWTGRNHKIRKIMDVKKDENPNYATFLDTLKSGLGAATKFDADKTLITDAYAGSGYTGVKFRKVWSDALGINTAGVFRNDSDVTALLWWEFVKDVDDLRNLPIWEFWKTPEEDRKARVKIMKNHVKDAFVIFLSEQGSDDYKLNKLMSSKTSPGEDFQRWGITFDDISQFTESSVDYPQNDDKIELIAKKALTYRKREWGVWDSGKTEFSDGRLWGFTGEVKNRADGALRTPVPRPRLEDIED